jgi:hypothetical protein
MKRQPAASNLMMTPFPVCPIGADDVAAALRGRHDVGVMGFAHDGAEVIKRRYQRGCIGPLWHRRVLV